MSNKYPLRLKPYVKETIWGGSWLSKTLGRTGPDENKLGESWEAYSESQIINGSWAGRTLEDIFKEAGAEMFGSSAMTYPKFPLLVKFIDAKDNLSVQVHPDDELAKQLENYPFGKTEFWYVMQAEAGAEICYSLNSEAKSREQIKQALINGNLLDFVQRSPVKAGDVVFIPAGTIHALTKGIVVYELQQDCDITYRLYDWGRQGRQLHVDKGMLSTNFNYRNLPVTHPTPEVHDGYESATLVTCQYFTAETLTVFSQAEFKASSNSFTLLTVLEGKGNLKTPDNSPEKLQSGDTLLIPAGLEYGFETKNKAPLKIVSGTLG